MRIEDAMSHPVYTCTRHNTLEEAADRMRELGLGCLVVVDDARRPVGMLTDRDVAIAAYARPTTRRARLVEDAMSAPPVTCFPGTRLSEVEQLMRDNRVRRIPVVDSDGRLIGIVGLGDLVRAVQTSSDPSAEWPGFLVTIAGLIGKRASSGT